MRISRRDGASHLNAYLAKKCELPQHRQPGVLGRLLQTAESCAHIGPQELSLMAGRTVSSLAQLQESRRLKLGASCGRPLPPEREVRGRRCPVGMDRHSWRRWP